ncbi:MAG: arsenate reductase ArsC [Candidatus Omnitrophica bacterium]|nr:arsenate reductase ArsC [Candidatus Omnitrophota bacterium]
MTKTKILFVCIHNSARSQMAEAFVNQLAGDRFEAKSAGIEPGRLNPVVVEVMQDIGIDISSHQTKSVQQFIDDKEVFDYIITVCDETSAERCPVVPGAGQRLHMGFPDPSSFNGAHEEKLEQTKKVRDQIKSKVLEWIQEL